MSAEEREIRDGMRFAPGVVQGHWVTQLLILLDEARKQADHEKANREECIRKKRNEHERTKEIAALSKKAGWEAGAADMRELAAQKVELHIIATNGGKRVAELIRALPLTTPSAGVPSICGMSAAIGEFCELFGARRRPRQRLTGAAMRRTKHVPMG